MPHTVHAEIHNFSHTGTSDVPITLNLPFLLTYFYVALHCSLRQQYSGTLGVRLSQPARTELPRNGLWDRRAPPLYCRLARRIRLRYRWIVRPDDSLTGKEKLNTLLRNREGIKALSTCPVLSTGRESAVNPPEKLLL